jgi:ABC-type dipeptide/oligopeptide/nickel transport system ATPase subunit
MKVCQRIFENKNGKPYLIILDDVLDVVYSEEVCNLFTKCSHHRNISVILITQNHYHQLHFCRDISLNAKYLAVLKTLVIVISLCVWPVK